MTNYNPYAPKPDETNSDGPPPAEGAGWYMSIVSLLLIVVNGPLLKFAYDDQSWGAFGIAIFFAPIANGVMLLIFVLYNALLGKRVSASYYAVAIGFPVIAVVVDWIFISSLDLHGC